MKKITLILSMLLLVTISWQSYAQPANDDCAGAIGLTVNPDDLCGTITSATTNLATASPEVDDVTGTPNNDVWFTFVALAADQTIVISNVVNLGGGTSISTDMGMGVYDGSAGCGSLVFFNDSDPNTLNLTGLTVGITYYLRVYGWFSSVQNNDFDVCVGVTPPPPPPPVNDTLAGAIAIVPSAAGTGCTTFTFMDSVGGDGTTDSGLDGSCDGTFTGLDRFYSWTATSDALIWNDGAGNPGIVIRDALGAEITCESTFAAADVELSGWAVGDDLIIQIYDFNAADVDTSFCLEEFTLPLCQDPSAMTGNVGETTNDLVWTAGAAEDMWEIVYGIAPYVVPVDPTVDPSYMHVGPGATPDAMLTGLTGMSDYNLFYRAHCGGADYSNWVQFDFTTLGPPPANDNACNAMAIVVNDPAIVGNNTDSTMEVGEPNGSCWFGTSGSFNSVWYTFDAIATFATVSTDFNTALFDTHITIYEITDCTDMTTLTELGCDEDGGSAGSGWNSIATLSGLTIGNTYYVQVEGYTSSIGEFNIEVTTTPANDDLCDATEIIVDAVSAGDAFTSEFATSEVGEVAGSCFNGGVNGSVWFTFVAPAGGEVIVTTDIAGGTLTDTEVAVYEAPTDCTDASTIGAELGCDQDGGTVVNFNSIVTLTGLTAGTTYYVQVDRWGSAADGTFGIEVNTPPACPNVANLAANNFTAPDSADLSWDAAIGATGYNWEVQPQGVAQGTAGAIAMGSTVDPVVSATATGFVADSMYTLYVQSDCGGGALGDWFSLDFTFILAPSNDLCATPIALTVGTARDQNVVTGNNTSTTDSGEIAPTCANYAGGDLWYSAVVPANGNMTVETMPVAGGDGGLAVYSGACGALTELACNDDDGDGLFGFINLTGLTPGDTLLIRVWEFGNNAIIDFDVVAYSPNCPDLTNLVANNFTAPDAADISWDAVVASGYNYEIQPQGVAQGTAGAIAMGSTIDPVVTATVTGLVDGTDYTLYVQSDCGGGALGNWFSLDFLFALPPVNDTFAGAIPIVPSLEGTGCAGGPTFTLPFSTDGTTDSGMDGSCNAQGLDQFFSWTATTNALTFDSQTPGDPGIVVYDATTGTEIACLNTFTSPGTLTGWAVGDDLIIQIYDFEGTALSDVAFCLEELNITAVIPDCPTLTGPADGSIDLPVTPLTFDLTWDAPTTGDVVDSYSVYGGTDPAALGLIASGITDLFLTVNVNADLLTIYWQVVAVNVAGESVGCAVWSFTTMDTTADNDGDGVLNGDEATNGSDINAPCDPVQPIGYTGYDGTNAIWGAADCDGDGQTNAQEFAGGSDPYDVNSTVSIDDLEAVGFNYYPNPVSKDLHLTARENITNVSIYNMIGQEVKRLTPSSLETTIDMSNLANGTYFVKAQVGNAVGTFKVVKK